MGGLFDRLGVYLSPFKATKYLDEMTRVPDFPQTFLEGKARINYDAPELPPPEQEHTLCASSSSLSV